MSLHIPLLYVGSHITSKSLLHMEQQYADRKKRKPTIRTSLSLDWDLRISNILWYPSWPKYSKTKALYPVQVLQMRFYDVLRLFLTLNNSSCCPLKDFADVCIGIARHGSEYMFRTCESFFECVYLSLPTNYDWINVIAFSSQWRHLLHGKTTSMLYHLFHVFTFTRNIRWLNMTDFIKSPPVSQS